VTAVSNAQLLRRSSPPRRTPPVSTSTALSWSAVRLYGACSAG